MNYRFFPYSGNKLNYVDIINPIIEHSTKSIYVEPFVGSGAILFNLEKEFDKYIINDLDRNIIGIYNSFNNIDYDYFIQKEKEISDMFGVFKAPAKNKEMVEQAKKNYYAFRNWFNKHHWNTNTIDEGIYCYMLANMVINSFLRFSPIGMNQSFGNRHYSIDEDTFKHIKNRLAKTIIYNTDYRDIIEKYPDAMYFLDPPYYSQDSSYKGFSLEQYLDFLDIISDKEFIYTDILNDYNMPLYRNRSLVRDMRNTSPNRKSENTGNMEYIFVSDNFKDII